MAYDVLTYNDHVDQETIDSAAILNMRVSKEELMCVQEMSVQYTIQMTTLGRG